MKLHKLRQFCNRLSNPYLAAIKDTPSRRITGIVVDVALVPEDCCLVCILTENPVNGQLSHVYLDSHMDLEWRIKDLINCNYAMVRKLERFYGDKISSKAFKMAYQFEQDVKSESISLSHPILD